jgi:hypothetical protein
MSNFIRYQHLVKFGREEVENIELGTCYIFPKLDGTNGSVWADNTGRIYAASRNRILSEHEDNAGFYNWVMSNDPSAQNLRSFLIKNTDLVIYGEWLVPHTLTTYRDDVWRKFHIFDVYNRVTGKHLSYPDYSQFIDIEAMIIPPLAIVKNPTVEILEKYLANNVFYIKENSGIGEGIVIKNYSYINKFAEQVWAKMVANEFKENHVRKMGPPKLEIAMIEDSIVNKFVDQTLVDKTFSKIASENNGLFENKHIPQLLGRVWYDLITEDMFEILKVFKRPIIDFNKLEKLTISKIKQLRKDIF